MKISHSQSLELFALRIILFPLSITFFVFVFDSISSNIDEVLFGDFNVHHKDWLSYSDGTDQLGEICYNFYISNDLTQKVNFPTRIPDCDSHSPTFLDFFLSSDASICSTIPFPALENSDYVVALVSIDFPS